jgi:RNA polymerase sigma-70 factor (ECF subfamily)
MGPANNNQNKTQNERWTELAALAQEGDSRAFSTLLKDIVPFIRSVLSGTLSNQDWIDDITQDVLISVHKSLHTYSPDRPFRPWMTAIISFRRTDHLRKYYRNRQDKHTSLGDKEFLAGHVTNVDIAGELKDVEAALGKLPEKQRKVFTMLKIEGYSAKEIANEMGMSVSAVKVSAHRAMKKLKQDLG